MANVICLMEDLCRLCLDEPGIHEIFKTRKLLRDILLCTGIRRISSTDSLPKKICTTCMYKVEAAKDLQKYSSNNDIYMKSLLHSSATTVHKILQNTWEKKRKELSDNAPSQKRLTRASVLEEMEQECDVVTSQISVKSVEDINSSTMPLVILQDCLKKISTPNKKNTTKDASLQKSLTRTTIEEQKCNKPSEVSTPNEKNTSNDAANQKSPAKSTIEKQKCDRSAALRCAPSRVSASDRKESDENKSKHSDKLQCDICMKSYPTRKKLYLHQRSHSKNLYCPLDACGKKFYIKSDLQKHIRTHTGEKPYECDLCDKRFTQNVSLKLHKRAVHIEYM